MAALRSSDINRFIARGGEGKALVLVYGPDEGLVRSRIRALITALLGENPEPLSLQELEAERINQDAGLLLDEANAMNMFGGRRVILVRQAGKLNKTAWQPLFSGPSPASVILFQADDLAKSSPLRSAAEATSEAAAIACYPPSAGEMQQLVEARLSSVNLGITPPARAYLLELLGADYALSESEIEKLTLYGAGKLTIDIADIDAIIADSSSAIGTEAIDAAFEAQLEAIETIALRSFREGINPSGLIAMALNHALLLRRLVSARQSNQLDAALRQERLFFKRQDRIRKQAEHWSHESLARAVDSLAQAQDQMRRNASLEETIAVRALWSIALASRKR